MLNFIVEKLSKMLNLKEFESKSKFLIFDGSNIQIFELSFRFLMLFFWFLFNFDV